MQLWKTRAHVQEFRLEPALFSVFDLVELVICGRVIEISFGVKQRPTGTRRSRISDRSLLLFQSIGVHRQVCRSSRPPGLSHTPFWHLWVLCRERRSASCL